MVESQNTNKETFYNTTIINAYTPTEESELEDIEKF